MSRMWRKHRLKRSIKSRRGRRPRQGAKRGRKTAAATGKAGGKAVGLRQAASRGGAAGRCCLCAPAAGMLQSCMSSLVTLGNGVGGGGGRHHLPIEDADLLAAEAAYCAMEDELQRYLDTYNSTHDYDEYHFDLDEHRARSLCAALHPLRAP